MGEKMKKKFNKKDCVICYHGFCLTHRGECQKMKSKQGLLWRWRMEEVMGLSKEDAEALYKYLQMLKESKEIDRYENGYKMLSEIEQMQKKLKEWSY